MMITIPAIEIMGISLSSHLDLPRNNALNNSPAQIGISTTFVVSQAISQKFTVTNLPASKRISSGVNSGASRLDIAVTAIESARLALPRYDMTLDANPLGQHPTKITPAAISFGKLNKAARMKAITGMMV